MTKHLVISGCSFSARKLYLPWQPWPELLNDHLATETFTNLAHPGAGNSYISTSVIQHLLTANLNPADTLVVIMWSGVTRKDLIVPAELYLSLTNYEFRKHVSGLHIVMSGGIIGSWRSHSIAKMMFDNLYKTSDNSTMALESLFHIMNTKNFLDSHGYKYAFMSYVNYWGNTLGQVSPNGDFNLPCAIPRSSSQLLKEIGLETKWIWADGNKNCFYEYAKGRDLLRQDNFHPNEDANSSFLSEIILPQLNTMYGNS
jgi:hypothetical protein